MPEISDILQQIPDIKVLYVEDEDFTRELTTTLLKKFFTNITVCKNGLEALEKFNKEKFDIVITDISMPKLSGIELAKQIRKQNKEIPIIFTSSNNETNMLLEAINLGADGFLIKPINLQKLENVLKKVLLKYLYQTQIYETKHYLKQFQEAVNESAIISKTDKNGIITYANENFEKISKYKKEELIGKSHNIIRHVDMPNEFFKEMWQTIKSNKVFKGVIKNRDKEGKSYYVKTVIKPISNLKGEITEYLAIREDITEYLNPKKMFFDSLKVKDDILVYMKLKNYEDLEEFYSFEILEKIKTKALDYLYEIFNKFYLVKEIFSLGNGEFGLFIDKKFLDDNLINNLKTIQQKIKLHTISIDEDIEYDISILMSIVYEGEYIYESARLGIKKLINENKEFIIANNLAKIHFEKAKENIKKLHIIKKAIINLNIKNFYQGIYNNKTKKIEKYEALVRIIDNGKILSPGYFLDAAKKGNYYHYITNIILDNAFNELLRMKEEISINLSFIDIEMDVIRHKIYNLLKIHKNNAHRITFELLEDESIKNMELMKDFVNEIKKFNVKIAIDDFGSGYSNYTRLIDLQPDILKIDGSIIKNIDKDEFSKSIVKSIVTFAKEQNLKTVAEFVENETIAKIVNSLGIDYSQGFFYSKIITF